MKRSAGVTVVAVLSVIGSLLMCAMGILMVAVAFIASAAHSKPAEFGSPTVFKGLLLVSSLFYFLPGIWGILTSIGLWRLKNWARISTIVFAVLLVTMGFFSGLMTALVPFPAGRNGGVDSSLMTGIRIGMGAFWLTLLGIGVWWLVFFTRAKVKRQFGEMRFALPAGSVAQGPYPGIDSATVAVGTGGVIAPRRPLSISIIAWLLLAGSLFICLSAALRSPAILFTKLMVGWEAAAVYLTFVTVQACIGIGLLRLRPAARIAAITYLVFGSLNSAVFLLAPGGHTRMLALMANQRSMFPWMRMLPNQPDLPIDITPFMVVGFVAGLAGVAIQLYFLITRRFAFAAP
ncbi:MAG: hypothetical protein ACLQLC_17710 [Candidatus Sulfotelmatobacter sp.]